MAPSSNFMLIALLVAITIVAPSLPSSTAEQPRTPSAAAAHPMDIFDDIIHFDLPLPRILPCPPCRSSLAKYLAPCAGVLTDGGAPFNSSSDCCGTIQPFFEDKKTTLFCLCHVLNGDAGEILHAPVNHTRALCGYGMTPDMFPRPCAADGCSEPATTAPPRN
ncbi:unnamed protein product [Urochloa decumbens]|uniref:Bifunctional inhibitor/plant lipid transfer protein/seed storage helical domain-containing protein n=1 Tax=Urochloa decumbens TaxID=240449 RepID=A0ABC9G991_9POAL